MLLQIKSDTHNEFYYNKTRMYDPNRKGPEYINPEADVIVLAGDIATPDLVGSIVRQYGDCEKPVLYVAGNHDYWGSTIEEAQEMRKRVFKDTNITELDASTLVLKDVAFIGATLWTNLDSPVDQNIARRTKDFELIKGMTPERWNDLHHKHRDYIEHALKSDYVKDKKRVVITHYLPSFKCTPKRFIGDPTNCIFASHCDDLMEMDAAPVIWVHGHTHDSFDYKNGNTRILCNPFGYWGWQTNSKYNESMLIEI